MQIIQKIIIKTFFCLLTGNGVFAADAEESMQSLAVSSWLVGVQPEYSVRPTYSVKLDYWCAPSKIHYGNMGFVGIHASNGQEFVTKEWRSGKYLPFVAYRTEKKAVLNLTDNMFPLTLTVIHYRQTQRLDLLRDLIYNSGRNTKLSDFKVWIEDLSPIVFEINKEDVLGLDGKQETAEMVICSLAPGDHATTFLQFFCQKTAGYETYY